MDLLKNNLFPLMIKFHKNQKVLFPNEMNAYNTRVKSGLPVSPICIMGRDAIDAVINPDKTDYLYFVSDKNKKLYFSYNAAEQASVISKLKAEGLWL